MSTKLEWIEIPPSTLNVAATLDCGQNFRWLSTESGDRLGVIENTAVRIRPAEHGFWWQTYPENARWDLLHRYFAIDIDLDALYVQWIAQEPRIKSSIARNRGLRILRQDADEAFFSFLCASCNTVTKITRSVQALAREYGEPIAVVEGQMLYRFPTAQALMNASETVLRNALWGYRAPRVIEAAQVISSHGEGWLESLRKLSYGEAHAALVSIHGIGAKIADCICLFGLWHDTACPVDTHVRQIAVRMYQPELRHKSLTPTVYNTLSGALRDRFGDSTGWAQQYLFYDELQDLEDI